MPGERLGGSLGSGLFGTERLHHGGEQELPVADRGEADEEHAVSEALDRLRGESQSQSRLPCSARARQGHETNVVAAQEGTELRELA